MKVSFLTVLLSCERVWGNSLLYLELCLFMQKAEGRSQGAVTRQGLTPPGGFPQGCCPHPRWQWGFHHGTQRETGALRGELIEINSVERQDSSHGLKGALEALFAEKCACLGRWVAALCLDRASAALVPPLIQQQSFTCGSSQYLKTILMTQGQSSILFSHSCRRNNWNYLKVRQSWVFWEKVGSAETETLPMIAHTWKKFLPRDACRLWSTVKLNNKTGNELPMVHALVPVFLLLPVWGSAPHPHDQSPPHLSGKNSEVIRSVAIEKALT